MKIAVLLAGHLRTWEYCKANFIDTLYSPVHDIDIFIETYDQLFRTDYEVHNEHLFKKRLTQNELTSLFTGLNVVSLNSENEVTGLANINQARKLLKVFDTFCEYEIKRGTYDLVVKTRPDILLMEKVDYEKILKVCNNNSKHLFISRGGVNCLPLENDLVAISTSIIMKLYMGRFREFPEATCTHQSLGLMAKQHELSIENNIDVSIVRPSQLK